MMKRLAIVCSVAVLLTSWALASCTRAKPETPTPTVVASAGTALPTPSAPPTPTGTRVITPEPSPTAIPLTPGLTTVSVAEPTAALGPATTPAVTTPTSPPSSGQFEYTVQWGDTLYSLARRFNTTVEAIVALNAIQDSASIQVGQVLKIQGTPGSTSGSGAEYIVQAGDTLFSIAQRYNTTVEAIQRANGMVNAWLIQVGQRLVIPQGSQVPSSPGGSTYVVQPGDTLYSIAARLGKNVWDLIVANNLSDPYWIYVGQVLTIPS